MCHYFLEKTSKKRKRNVVFSIISVRISIITGVLNAAMWNVFVGTLLQRTKYWTLFNCPSSRNYDTPCSLKPFLFILKIDKWHDFTWLCYKDPQKEVQAREDFFSAFLCQRLQFFRSGKKEIHTIFIKLKEVVKGSWREVEVMPWRARV